ncbi:MAG: mechanosensitive ion channel [Chitinophaga sp.]|uniref:mechanosensitive ion channel family protein n=1 Tax=Chitinophaga sp. TaxID=1869181 RepID=UPI001B2DEAE5|nr:mechanosensitive ion channel domain-containing protein [Chitinophaga sp.]MBO9728666.1 mechanosensitive ion channel [Chitinophaga sp.]
MRKHLPLFTDWRPFGIILYLLLAGICGQGQQRDSSRLPQRADSTSPGFVTSMQQYGKKASKKSIDEFAARKIAMRQEILFEQTNIILQRAKNYLRTGIDTNHIKNSLDKIKEWSALAGDGIFVNKGSAQSYRNLTNSYNLLLVLQKRVEDIKNQLDKHHAALNSFAYQLDSLSTDPAIFTFPDDSVQLIRYIQKMKNIARGLSPMDNQLKQATAKIDELLAPTNTLLYDINSQMEEIEQYQLTIYARTFDRDFPALWQPFQKARPLKTILYYSWEKSLLTLRFYLANNKGKVFLTLVVLLGAIFYIQSLKKVSSQSEYTQTEKRLLFKFPVLSAIIVVFSLFQFLFLAQPFLFTAICWAFPAISLTFVFRGYISRYWLRFWVLLLVLFFLACLDNMVLQASRPERWAMVVLALCGIVLGTSAWSPANRAQLKEKWIIYAIGLMVILEVASIVTNLVGCYNLSKTLLTSGYFNAVIAILFLWTVRIINEAMEVGAIVYTTADPGPLNINFQKIGNRAHPLFYLLLIVGWFLLFGRNFYAFKLMTDPFRAFLSAERQIGDFTFSIDNITIFIAIVMLSVIISRIVSFFAGDNNRYATTAAGKQRTGIGSWILLVRIGIITLGVLLAFAAAGIPMSRLALFMGAIGVGIGFGLQSLVNNLVSGLIIAFEKPINVGDVIDIKDQSGKVKSIGFRSSTIATTDGADLIMPNGDLLTAHLLNWSSNGHKRRMAITVGVSYDTDLEKAKALLLELFTGDKRILGYPAPKVIFKEFNQSSIDIQLFFWVRHLAEAVDIKSDLIAAITSAFREHGISIPFPQQDIHISPLNPPTGGPRIQQKD